MRPQAEPSNRQRVWVRPQAEPSNRQRVGNFYGATVVLSGSVVGGSVVGGTVVGGTVVVVVLVVVLVISLARCANSVATARYARVRASYPFGCK